MQRLTKNIPIFDIEPGLVREWHPSSNGMLTPRNVTLAYPKRVWWICKQGHEWKATLKSRRKRRGCPSCESEQTRYVSSGSKTTSWRIPSKYPEQTILGKLIKSDLPGTLEDEIGKNFRKSRRHNIRAIALLEIPNSGHFFYAEIRNYSHGGLYLETEAALTIGTRTILKLDKPFFPGGEKCYNSAIKWCSELDESTSPSVLYGLGIEFF